MRTPLMLAAAGLSAAALVASAPASVQTTPAISVSASSTGVGVVGHGFVARERVVLRASFAGDTTVRTVTATMAGRFSASFAGGNASCSPVVVTATGSRGSKAAYHSPRGAEPCGIDPGQ